MERWYASGTTIRIKKEVLFMNSAKKEKIFEDLTIGVYKGVPNYFGIYWDDEGKGLWVCSQTRVYSILRLNARIMDESGRVLTFD